MRTDRKRQKRHLLPGLWLAAMLLMLSLTAGCGKSGKNAQSEPAAPAKTEFELAEPEKDLAQELLEAAGQHPEELQGIAEAVLQAQEEISSSSKQESKPAIDEDGWYDSKDEVALYIHTYGHLPGNYITKKEAQKLGWPGGSLEPYAPGKSIGGDHFGNYEGLLPKVKGSSYRECDIGTAGRKSRGAKRIIFSDDGRIYYTDDHYESFTQLY